MYPYSKSRFTIEVDIIHRGAELSAIYNTLSGALVLCSRDDWAAILHNGGDPAARERLNEQGILKAPGTDETQLYHNWKLQHVYSPGTIKSRMIVTRRCNMRCRYCLIDKEARDMTSETAEEIDKFYLGVIREAHPFAVCDEAGGAETMLNPGVLIESATRRFYFCEGLGIPYSLSMVTNCSLVDRRTIERLRTVGLKMIRVSIAGPARIHNALRPFKDGGGTYEIVLRNLAAVSDLVSIMIECQYDSASNDHEAIPEMFDDFEHHGVKIDKIRFCPILPTRTDSPFQSGIGDPEIYLRLTREARNRGYTQFDVPPSNRCAADVRYHYVFDTNGEIVPCPALQGAEFACGDVRKGVNFVEESKLLMRRLPDKCLNECELLPLCMGGCRQQALATRGDFHGINCLHDSLRMFLESYVREKAEEALAAEGDLLMSGQHTDCSLSLG